MILRNFISTLFLLFLIAGCKSSEAKPAVTDHPEARWSRGKSTRGLYFEMSVANREKAISYAKQLGTRDNIQRVIQDLGLPDREKMVGPKFAINWDYKTIEYVFVQHSRDYINYKTDSWLELDFSLDGSFERFHCWNIAECGANDF